MRALLGDFDFPAMQKATPVGIKITLITHLFQNTYNISGPWFFIFYIFSCFFILLNMFLAIINDTYRSSPFTEPVDPETNNTSYTVKSRPSSKKLDQFSK